MTYEVRNRKKGALSANLIAVCKAVWCVTDSFAQLKGNGEKLVREHMNEER